MEITEKPASGRNSPVRPLVYRPSGSQPPRLAFHEERNPTIQHANELQVPISKPAAIPSPFTSHLAHRVIAWPVGVWGVLDMLIALGSMAAGHNLSPVFQPEALQYRLSLLSALYAVVLFLCSYSLGVYSRTNFNSAVRLTGLCIGANLLALGATTVIFSWLRYHQIGRYVLFFTFILCSCVMTLFRVLARGVAGRSRVRVLFVGRPALFRYLGDAIEKQYGSLYAPPEYLELTASDPRTKAVQILEAYESQCPDEIVVEDDAELLLELLHCSAPIVARGTILHSLSAFHEELLHEVPLQAVDCRALLGSGWGIGRQSTETTKRIFDIVAAGLGLLLTAPILILAAAAVKLFSQGPIFYRQERVGRFGAIFNICKFRTMRVDAEQNGPMWAAKKDSRVTVIGRLLRKTRLDELPQLWNVLKGDMSLVGPRPERPEFVADLERQIPYYQLRLLVPPGLTGWAQIRYPYGASLEDANRKLSFDLFYVRHYGVLFDVAICMRTVLALARGSR